MSQRVPQRWPALMQPSHATYRGSREIYWGQASGDARLSSRHPCNNIQHLACIPLSIAIICRAVEHSMHSTLEKKSNVCMYFLPSTLSSAIINSSLLREYLEILNETIIQNSFQNLATNQAGEKREREREWKGRVHQFRSNIHRGGLQGMKPINTDCGGTDMRAGRAATS